MNLFANIFDQFTGKAQSQVPTSVPQAPRTSSYVAPNVPYTPEVQKPNMTLFSDEQKMFEKMKADNLDDNTAFSMLKKRRMDILGGNDISQQETDILKKMQADNVPVKQAVSMIQQRRKDQFNKKYEEGNLLQKGAYNALAFGAGNLETLAKYSGNALDFITGGTMGFGDEVKKMEQVTQSPEFSESSAFKAGTYAPDVALAVSPIGGGYLAGAKGLPQLAMRSGVVGAGFGATQPILEQGSDVSIGDIATGAAIGGTVGAVASPVLSKAFKYGQAGYYGGVTGAGKSIVRDLKGVGQAITPSGANISTKANRFNANEIREFTKKTGQSPGEFATSRGMTKVGDDAVVEATTLWQKSKDQADEALQAIKGRFKFTGGKDLLKSTLDDLDDRLTKTESPDLARIQQLKAKYEDSGLTMSEINEVKRAYSNNYKYSFVDAGSESALRSRNLQDAVRKWQFKVAEENGLTNLKDINKTTQGWKMFADSLSKKIQGSSGNNNVSLTDWIALSGGSPENIALYLGKKLASSDRVKSGAIKLFSKKTKPSIIQASKADIQQANFKKDVNRGVSGIGDRSGGESLVKPVGLLPAPTGKATGAKNFRVNQPKEAPTQKSDITRKSIIKRPTTTARGIKADVQLAKETIRAKEVAQIEKDLNTALLSKYNPDKQKATTDFIERAMAGGKIKKQEAIQMVENLYEKADGFQKPRYEKLLNDLYSNKKVETFDDLLNEKQAQTIVKTPRQQYLETPKGIYEEINKKANDRRYNPEKANILIAKFKEKTGIDLMKNPLQKFDEKGNVIRTIVKPNSTTNAKQQVSNANASDTIPEGYFKNAFGEIVKNPSNSKGGFIRNPFAKPEPKRLFAGENSAQPPKGKTGWFKGADGKMRFEIDDSVSRVKTENIDTNVIRENLRKKLTDYYGTANKSEIEKIAEKKVRNNLVSLIKENITPNADGKYSMTDVDRFKTTKKYKTAYEKELYKEMKLMDDVASEFDKSYQIQGVKLGDVLDHPELFKQYPELENFRINIKNATNKYAKAEVVHSPEGEVLTINIPYTSTFKTNILHEIQHLIQSKEKFATGGSPSDFEFIKKYKSIDEAISDVADLYKKTNSETEKAFLSRSIGILREMKDKGYDVNSDIKELYKAFGGEVESRNVEARIDMTKAERAKTSPIVTEDVPRDKQIIRMDGKGPSMSIKVPEKKIVKPVEKTVKAISNEELDALTKKATELGKYDGSYDVTKGKKLYRGGSEDGVFWTDDIDIAKSFGDEGVAEKIITMKKPLDVRSKDIREYIKKNTDINIDDATSAYSRSLPEFKKLMKWAKENGYDGIIGKTSDNGLNFTGNEFVTLSPPKPLSQQKTVKPKKLTK